MIIAQLTGDFLVQCIPTPKTYKHRMRSSMFQHF